MMTSGDDFPEGLNGPGIAELFKAYQQAVDVNIISSITDTKGVITHVNEKFCEVSKYSREELIGQNHRIINSNLHPPDFFAGMWRTIGRGETWQGEIRNRAKDGSFYWVETVIIPVRDANGNVYRYLSLRQLITERKNIETERAEYTLRLRQMLDLTSHSLRAPLATCMGILNILEERPGPSAQEELQLLLYLRQSALRLDEFTRELTKLLNNLQKEYQHIIPENIPHTETEQAH